MQRYVYVLHGLSTGAISLGILQALGAINFNQIWYSFLLVLLNAFVALLFGGDPSAAFESTGLLGGFDSFFL